MVGVGDTGTVWMVQREVKLHSNATKPTYLAFVVPREYSISSPESRLPLTAGCRSASHVNPLVKSMCWLRRIWSHGY